MKRVKIHRAWIVFIGVCLFNMLGYGLIVNCFGNFLLPTSEGLGISVTEVSLTHSVRTICGTLGSLLAGQLMQRVNLKVYLSGICGALALAAFFTTLSTALWQLLLAAVLMGFSVGMGIYTLVALVIPQWFRQPEGYIGFATACGGVGGIIFAPILSWVMSTYSWKSGYYIIIGVVLLVMAPIALAMIRYRPGEIGLEPYGREKEGAASASGNPAGPNLKGAAKTPSFYLVILFFVAVALVAGVYTHMPSMLGTRGFEEMQIGYMYSFYQLGAAVSQLLVGLLCVKFNYKRTICAFLGLILVGILGVGFLGGGVVLTTLFVLLVGCGRAIGVVAGPILVRNTSGQAHYNSIFSCLYTAYLGFVAVSTTFYGIILDSSGRYTIAYIAIVVCCVIAMSATILCKSLVRPKRQPEGTAFPGGNLHV